MTQPGVRTWAGPGRNWFPRCCDCTLAERLGSPPVNLVHPCKPLTNKNTAWSLLLRSVACVSDMLCWYRWSTQLHKTWSKVNLLSRCWKKRARSCLLGDIQAFEKQGYFFRPSKLFLDIAGWAVLSVLLSFPHLSKGLKLRTVSFNNSIHHVCKKFLFLQEQTAVHLFK